MVMRKLLVLAAAFVVMTGTSVLAVPLPPGTSNLKPSTVPVLGPPNYTIGLPAHVIAPNLVASLLAVPIVPALGSINGTMSTWVYKDPADGNTLTFVYLFDRRTDPDGASLIRATMGGAPNYPFGGWTITDAGVDGLTGFSTAGSIAPVWTDGTPDFLLRESIVSGEGIAIQWRAGFEGTSIEAGTGFSSLIWFDTNAPAYTTTAVGLIDSGAVSISQALAPLGVQAIPEPATLSLIGLGLLALARRRRKS
jgi:hypothetical protein